MQFTVAGRTQVVRRRRNPVEDGADPARLPSRSVRRAQEGKQADLAGSEYDRVLLISMLNARFACYQPADEVIPASRPRVA